MMMRIIALTSCVLFASSIWGVAQSQQVGGSTILDRALADPDLMTLVLAIQTAGLADLLAEPGPYTVFAPVLSAFEALDPALQVQLLTPEFNLHLQNVLAYHVVSGAVLSTDLVSDGQVLEMLNSDVVTVNLPGTGEVILRDTQQTGSTVVEADIIASNGVIHKIDGTILLPNFVGLDIVDLLSTFPEEYSLLVSLVQTAGLEDALRMGILTILAPNNAAFEALPEEIGLRLLEDAEFLAQVLSYHAIEGVSASTALTTGPVTTLAGPTVDVVVENDGTNISINGIPISAPDGLARNGIVHGISAVLLLPSDIPGPSPVAPPTPSAIGTIVDVAAADPELSTLVDALATAGLVDFLAGGGSYTVFAPVNEAFETFPAYLLEPQFNLHLQNVLVYHVTDGVNLSSDLTDGLVLEMFNVEPVMVSRTENDLLIIDVVGGESSVVEADLPATNGVVHKIGGGFLSPSFLQRDVVDQLASNPDYSLLVSLIQTAGLEEALRSGTWTILAPNNAAIEALPEEIGLRLLADAEFLTEVLTYHVIEGVAVSAALTTGPVTTLAGATVDVVVGDSGITINTIPVTEPDGLANRGVIHGIASVLLPPAITPVPPPVSPPTPSGGGGDQCTPWSFQRNGGRRFLVSNYLK